MSLPENVFWPFSPRVGLGCYLMKQAGRGSQALLTRPARGEWWCAVTDRVGSAWRRHRKAWHRGQGGDIDVKGTECSGNTEPHLPWDTALYHTWMTEYYCDSVGELGRYPNQSAKRFPLRFWLMYSGDGVNCIWLISSSCKLVTLLLVRLSLVPI